MNFLSRLLSSSTILGIALALIGESLQAAEQQWVEGFDAVQFHHDGNRTAQTRDFRGLARGYMTAAWWTTQIETNYVSWKTAVVPEKKATTFSFIAATPVLPSEFSQGPAAKLTVNDQYALTFTIGLNRDFVWKEGEFQLKYISKRVEYPFSSTQRQFDLHGNSGIYQLSVPAAAVEAGKPVVLKVEILPFKQWSHGWFTVKEHRDTLKQSMATLQSEIEALRQDLATIHQQTQILARKAYPELAVDTNQFTHEVIYGNGFRHVHPADLIRLQNGELLMMWREGTEHISDDGDVVMLRSKDGGKTWGGRQVIAAIEKSDEREGCGLQLRDGTIVVGIFYNNLYNTSGAYNYRHQHLLKEKNRLGAYTITSSDNGQTWSKPNYVDTTEMPFRNVEGPTDAPIEMPDGSILMAIIGYNFDGDEGNRSSVMLRSTDKGTTWKYYSTIASDPGNKLGGFMEPGITRTKTGRIVAAMRNHNGENAIWATYSDDDGKTWAPVQKTAMIGHPTDLIQLSDGRVMASYGIRPTVHARPGGIRACFSNDNGKTWDITTEVQLRNDFLNWDVGYPESMEMPDGTVLTVYYYNLFGKYYLGGTHWNP